MRPVLHGDVTMAGLALLAAPPTARAELLARMLHEADLADAYRRATGTAHPLWGSGSLMSAAMARPRRREPYLDNPEYAACLAMVFEALVARGSGRGTG
jgi:hypothetical protein